MYDDKKYNVSVEFEKFSKKFSNVPRPKLESHGNAAFLVVEDRNRTVLFSWNQVQFVSVEEVKA